MMTYFREFRARFIKANRNNKMLFVALGAPVLFYFSIKILLAVVIVGGVFEAERRLQPYVQVVVNVFRSAMSFVNLIFSSAKDSLDRVVASSRDIVNKRSAPGSQVKAQYNAIAAVQAVAATIYAEVGMASSMCCLAPCAIKCMLVQRDQADNALDRVSEVKQVLLRVKDLQAASHQARCRYGAEINRLNNAYRRVEAQCKAIDQSHESINAMYDQIRVSQKDMNHSAGDVRKRNEKALGIALRALNAAKRFRERGDAVLNDNKQGRSPAAKWVLSG